MQVNTNVQELAEKLSNIFSPEEIHYLFPEELDLLRELRKHELINLFKGEI